MKYLIAFLLVACGKSDAPPAAGPPGGGMPVEVGVVTVKPEAVTLIKELPGRTSAFRVAEVRARVNGIVQKRLFEEGSDVVENQPLFKIDPAPYQAALEERAGAGREGQCLGRGGEVAGRAVGKLIESNAVSRQEYDDA